MNTKHMPKVDLYLSITIVSFAWLGGILIGNYVGVESATKRIAQACIDENTFDVDGYKFYCIDEEDYYDPTGVQDLDSSPAEKGAAPTNPTT